MRAKSVIATSIAGLIVGLISMASLARADGYLRPGSNELVTVNSAEVQQSADPVAGAPNCGGLDKYFDISSSGRFVVFSSTAANLVAGDTNEACDVFVRDRKKGITERVSIASDGTQGLVGGDVSACGVDYLPHSFGPSISDDGRRVAFTSYSSNLVFGDTNLAPDIFVHNRVTGATDRVSVASDGSQALAPLDCQVLSGEASISGDGQVVAFHSAAASLVEGDLNASADVFVHLMTTEATRRVSLPADGDPLGGGGQFPSISGNGRFVTYLGAEDLVEGDTNNVTDVFVSDLDTGKIDRVSLATGGAESQGLEFAGTNLSSVGRQISADGRFVVYSSDRQTLVPNDANVRPSDRLPARDVFVFDRKTNRNERVSVLSTGEEANNSSGNGSFAISGNGRYVTFKSWADNMFAADEQRGPDIVDVYVYDRHTGELDWVSAPPVGAERSYNSTGCADSNHSLGGALSFSGRQVVFGSCMENLVGRDANDIWDYFVRERGQELGSSVEVGLDRDSRFTRTKISMATDTSEAGALSNAADIVSGRIAYRPALADLYFVLDVEKMSRVGPLVPTANRDPAIVYGFSFEANGERYEIRAHSLIGPLFELFRCNSECVQVARLRGGVGTTGDSATIALPLADINMKAGGRLSDVEGYTALNNTRGILEVLDSISFD